MDRLAFPGIPVRCLALMVLSLVVMSACGRRPPPPLPPPAEAPSPEPSETAADPAVAAPELEVWVEPSTIQTGESALLSWESQNAERVLIDHNIGIVDPSGRIKFFPDVTTTYRVTAEGRGGRVDRSVTVKVVPDRPGELSLGEKDLRGLPPEERFKEFVRPVFFAFDSGELSEDARLVLDMNFSWLQRPENSSVRILIEGHCDERGTEEYNLALGDRRALVVRDYLVTRGMDPSRIETISFGEERPFDPRTTEEAYALNRRAHFVILSH